MIFLTFAACTTYFYIRQAEEASFIANVNGKMVLSDVYSPIKFIFENLDNNTMSLVDSSTKKGAEVTFRSLKERPVQSKREQEFRIVFSSKGKYYIMYEDKCLQVKGKSGWLLIHYPKNYKTLKLDSCSTKNDKLFDVRFDAKLIKEYDHIITHDHHHDNHLHYHAYDHYCGYHNCNNRKGYSHMMKDILSTEGHGHEVFIDANEFYLS